MKKIPAIRNATIKDIDFIIETITESEKSGTPILSYQTIFLLDIIEIKSLLKNILIENVPGHQYYIPNFLIAEIDNCYAGSCCSWIEGQTGISSSLIQANLLLDFIDPAHLKDIKYKLNLAHSISISREFGTLQIDNVFVKQEYRGLGISGMLIQNHIDMHKREKKDMKAQIILNKTNENAYRSYSKLGFKITFEISSPDKEILKYMPSDTNILMEKIIS